MSEDTKYNGWTNDETWLVKLWLDDDGLDSVCQDIALNNPTWYDCGQAIKTLVEEQYVEEHVAPNGLVADLVRAALNIVNWYEIADSFLKQIEPDESSDDDEEEAD